MARFLVERYAATDQAAHADVERLRALAPATRAMRLVGEVFLPGDQTSLLLIEAPDGLVLGHVLGSAGISFDRITEAAAHRSVLPSDRLGASLGQTAAPGRVCRRGNDIAASGPARGRTNESSSR